MFRSRYYSPAIGGFTSRDENNDLRNPGLYGYVQGSPATFVDPAGSQYAQTAEAPSAPPTTQPTTQPTTSPSQPSTNPAPPPNPCTCGFPQGGVNIPPVVHKKPCLVKKDVGNFEDSPLVAGTCTGPQAANCQNETCSWFNRETCTAITLSGGPHNPPVIQYKWIPAPMNTPCAAAPAHCVQQRLTVERGVTFVGLWRVRRGRSVVSSSSQWWLSVRPMFRRIFAGWTLASLPLSLAAGALWARGRSQSDELCVIGDFQGGRRRVFVVGSVAGCVSIQDDVFTEPGWCIFSPMDGSIVMISGEKTGCTWLSCPVSSQGFIPFLDGDGITTRLGFARMLRLESQGSSAIPRPPPLHYRPPGRRDGISPCRIGLSCFLEWSRRLPGWRDIRD